MKKLGIGFANLGANQAAYQGIIAVNQYLTDNYLCDIIGFYEMPQKKCLEPNFSCLPMSEIWGYDGTMIASNIRIAEDIINVPTIKNKFLYLWDLDWIHFPEKSYGKLKQVYQHPELKIITRNSYQSEVFSKMWNRKTDYIIPDFDINKMVELCQ